MNLNDTIDLLKECDAGAKMAVSSIDEVMDKVQNLKFRELLVTCKDKHTKLGNEIHNLLSRYRQQDKEPGIMAKGMSWAKANMKMAMDASDNTAADLITDGCNMGIKSLRKYLNEFGEADKEAKKICENLISIEENLIEDVKTFL